MRSIEYLIQLHPDKTGKELLEIQKQDKIEDELNFKKIHQNKLNVIEDINKNGGFYRGRFGLDQYFYYSFKNLMLDGGKIYCDCDHLVCFMGGSILKKGDFNFELRQETYKSFENFGVSIYERVTEKEWNEIIDYLNNSFKKFW